MGNRWIIQELDVYKDILSKGKLFYFNKTFLFFIALIFKNGEKIVNEISINNQEFKCVISIIYYWNCNYVYVYLGKYNRKVLSKFILFENPSMLFIRCFAAQIPFEFFLLS